MKPYYSENGITIYHGDCREVLPSLERFDLLLTDPPYGIGRDKGNASGRDGSGFYSHAIRKSYADTWDMKPSSDVITSVVSKATAAIVWGGNYFAHQLAESTFWLVWDKENTMPTFSDCELAWTSLPRKSVKKMTYCGNGLMGHERHRVHPTQKPLALMRWCLSLVPDAQTVLDPFMGSGTTLLAARLDGKQSVGIEMSEQYCEIAADRLSQQVFDFAEAQ